MTRRIYHVDGAAPELGRRTVFVFGSNLAGVHGAGAARAASAFGAIWGQGVGRQGMAYAIPTKSATLETLSLDTIRDYVAVFIAYAVGHPDNLFFVTRIGCGLAGYDDADIAPLFADAPENCSFAERWRPFLEGGA